METRASSTVRIRPPTSSRDPDPLEKLSLPCRPQLSSRLSRSARERTDRSCKPSLDLSRHALQFSRCFLTRSMRAMSKRGSCRIPSSRSIRQQLRRIRSADRALLASLPEPPSRLGPSGDDPFRKPNRHRKRQQLEPSRGLNHKALPRRSSFQIEAAESFSISLRSHPTMHGRPASRTNGPPNSTDLLANR